VHIPFYDLKVSQKPIEQELTSAYQRVLDSGWYCLGQELEAFEHEYALYNGVKHCVGVGNGLDALTLLLRAYGIGPGDEVIVPSNTYIATWLAVVSVGASIVPVEPSTQSHNIDVSLIEASLSSKTAAIMPVHLYGLPADMAAIDKIAEEHGLIVIADGAQSQGATIDGRPAAQYGHATATSFYPGKNLGAMGDGGAILTNDEVIAKRVKVLRNYGSERKYFNSEIGVNSRLDELQAAILRVKLKYLDEWNQARSDAAALYRAALDGVSMLQLPLQSNFYTSVWHQFVITHPQRDALSESSRKGG
jgi:dTDP-4-amino-4,6-dideoxygalactose transaminase